MRRATQHSIRLGSRIVGYRVALSATARNLRMRVGPGGVEVIQPTTRPSIAVTEFLKSNQLWLFGQLDRVARLGTIRRTTKNASYQISFRGVATPIRIEPVSHKRRENRIHYAKGEIVIHRGPASRTSPTQSLESWLRREARREIDKQIAVVSSKLRRLPNRVYVMNQRTKWGSCSRKRNLTFNWRLILARPEVLNYIVTHEVAHLVEANHSPKFWLLLRSHCPNADSARAWLLKNGTGLYRPLLASGASNGA